MKFKFSLLTLALFACSPEDQSAEQKGARPHKLRVLTYSSYLGKGSLGEWVKKEFESRYASTEITFTEVRDESGLAGEIKRITKNGDSADLAIGIDPVTLDRIGADNFLQTQVISSSPMSILVNKSRAPAQLVARNYKFKTWREVFKSGLLKQSLITQDPRFSSPGLSWLLQSHFMKGVSAKDAHGFLARVLPSWSSAFQAFEQGEGIAIWTYSSSLSYYQCQSKPLEYAYLDVEEGYVNSVEMAGVLKTTANVSVSKLFLEFLVSELAQTKMVELNWVYPAREIKLPDCYVPKSTFRVLSKPLETNSKRVSQWVDEWQLF